MTCNNLYIGATKKKESAAEDDEIGNQEFRSKCHVS